MAIQSPSLDLAGPAVRATPASASRGYWKSVRRRLRRDPVTLACAGILILIVLASIAAPWLGLADPYKTSMIRRLLPVGSPNYPLGTDELGRDMLARLIYGGRLSLFMGVTPVVAALLIGGLLGITAGFAGGRINMLIMRVMDVFYAFPSVLLAISLSGAMGAGTENTLLSLTLVFIPPICRVSESITTQVRGFDFVDAARAAGKWSRMRGSVAEKAAIPEAATGELVANPTGKLLEASEEVDAVLAAYDAKEVVMGIKGV